MKELNGTAPVKIKVLGPYTFSIGDTSNFSEYIRGGIATQVKMPQTLKFGSLAEQQADPSFAMIDFAKFDHPSQLHVAFDVLHEFIRLNGRAPLPWNDDDAKAFINLANKRKLAEPINEKLLTIFAKVNMSFDYNIKWIYLH